MKYALIVLLLLGSCIEKGKRSKYTIEITFKNGDKDTISFTSQTGPRMYSDELVNGDSGITIASDVRYMEILEQKVIE